MTHARRTQTNRARARFLRLWHSGRTQKEFRRGFRVSLVSGLAFAYFGCGLMTHSMLEESPPADAAPSAAPRLLPAGALPGNHFERQWVRIKFEEREQSFEAVFQKRDETLLLLGLGPMGRVGFKISLEGEKLSFLNQTGREMPFSPGFVLADVQRIFYPWIDGPIACESCKRRGSKLGFEIEETIENGRIARREFRVTGDESPRRRIIVRFADPNSESDSDSDSAPTPASEGRRRATLVDEIEGREVEVESLSIAPAAESR